jgi:cardiolipin synthase
MDDRQRKSELIPPLRHLAEQAFSRAAGAPLIPGNRVRLLKDAKENYPAWLEAMGSAGRSIHFESYIIRDDHVGEQFAKVLAAKAEEGIRVRLIYDWVGGFRKTSRRFWDRLRKAGVEVRCVNPPRFDSPLGWLSRDHRKMIAVDGRIGFVSGLCIGRMWVGDPERSIEPWRDTGVEVQGPAVAEIEQAFADVWRATGDPLPEDEVPEKQDVAQEGDVALRVVASVPNTAGLYRLDQLIAAVARRSLWLTDAYFVGVTPYVQALRAAAMDGVDVRLLVPGASDIPILRTISRTGYQPLLESGVRVFEWNGPMLHAKTAVADSRWARVGSTNLNLSSWVGNYELDVAVEDEAFARAMERMYEQDLRHSTEIVLGKHHRVRPIVKKPKRGLFQASRGGGSLTRAGAGAVRVSSAVGAAITNRRVLGPAETKIMITVSLTLLALALVGILLPRWVTTPLALFSTWVAVSLLVRAYRLYRQRGRKKVGRVD